MRVVFEYYDTVLSDWVQFVNDRIIAHGDTYKLFMSQGDWQNGMSSEVRAGNNVKFISSGQFDNGLGTQTLNDTNLTDAECPIRVRLIDESGTNFTTSSVSFWVYDGVTESAMAVGVEVYAFEQGEGNTSWTLLNDSSAGIGGSGDAMSLAGNSGASEYTYYLAISSRVESGEGEGDYTFAFGFEATIS